MNNAPITAKLLTARAYLRTRWLASRLETKKDVQQWQYKRLQHFLAKVTPRVEAYQSYAGFPLAQFPLMDKQQLMENFSQYNQFSISAEDGWNALAAGSTLNGCSVGASTGTSGNRSLYLVTDKERYEWLGVMLAKAVPDLLRVRHKVAVLLPANSSLYDAANEGGRLHLRFYDLHNGIESHVADLQRYSPSIVVAPPKVLLYLAESDTQIKPTAIFSGAEVLDANDRFIIETRFNLVVREIYMATEGLFGVACEHGTIHLAEDAVAFEWLPGPAGGSLQKPLITDFTRRTQLLVRYQMNDLLQISSEQCPCGSPFTAVSAIIGRMDDVFLLSSDQGVRTITPDILRNTVLDTNREIDDFRVQQTGDNAVTLLLPCKYLKELSEAKAALHALFQGLNVEVDITARCETLKTEHRKLRRVERIHP